MKNNSTIKLPKKYDVMIDEIFKTNEGYSIYIKKGYFFEELKCHMIHVKTQREVLNVVKTLKKCECIDCK